MKKKVIWIVLGILLVGLLGYFYKMGEVESYRVSMVNNKGEDIGVIVLNETNAGVLIGVDLRGLKPNGKHAIHIHEKADCTPLESFKNAGGHFNPEHKEHGLNNPKGHHAGDLPNLEVNEKGRIVAQMLNRDVTISKFSTGDNRASLFDKDGSAIVIHAGADDNKSQPSGAAGRRIACGVIK